MKLLLLGSSGQVGWELRRSLSTIGEVVAPERRLRSADDDGCLRVDLGDVEGLASAVKTLRPDVVVNAAGYTQVDQAESEEGLAYLVNAAGPGALARACAQSGAWLVHYSTDYVFDGSGSAAWDEEAGMRPVNAYGRSKAAGEVGIRESGCRHLIIRTSWVYGRRGANFARTMLRMAVSKSSFGVVSDQVGAPTGAELIADATSVMVRGVVADERLRGTYHLAASGETSWHGYASHVVDFARKAGATVTVAPDGVVAVASSEYRTGARRPLNSRLSTKKVQERFGLHLPERQAGVDRVLQEWLE